MGKLLKCINISFLVWCMLGAQVWGELDMGKGYWVVGSYRNPDMAAREAKRITDETGVKIHYMQSTVAGVDYYRLLVAHSGIPDELARLVLQLDSAGVHDSWPIQVDESQILGLSMLAYPEENGTPVTSTPVGQLFEGESTWLVIGSFTDYAVAQDLAEEVLGSLGIIPELRDFVVDNQSVIRVLAGPYLNSQQLEEARQQLMKAGYANIWSLKDDMLGIGMDSMGYSEGTMDSSLTTFRHSQATSAELQQQRIQLVQQTRDSARQPENTIRPGFNLATLRKRGE